MAKNEPNLTLVEEAPPPRRRGARREKYREHLSQLKENPGKWFRIMEDTPQTIQTATAYCRKHFGDEGYEFSVRNVDENASHLFAVFVEEPKKKK